MNKKYMTIQGDMWDSIAKKLYGDEAGMNTLMEANQAYIDTVIFPAGVELVVPVYKEPISRTLPPWRR